MKMGKHLLVMAACVVLTSILGACSPRITNIQVNQEPLRETGSPPQIHRIVLPNCYGTGPMRRTLSSTYTLQQTITLGTQAKASSGVSIDLAESIKASLTAEISRTYQQSFSAISTQMDQFTFEAEKNTETAYEIILREFQSRSTVTYTVKKLFNTTTYSVPFTYTIYIPDMEEGGSKRMPAPQCDGTQADVLRPLRIEAEGYAEKSSHVDSTECSEGGRLLGWINSGEWVSYEHIDFGSGGYKTFQARVASAEQGGEIDIRLDDINGQSLGVCQAPFTGGWQEWTTIQCSIDSDVTGKRTVFLLFTGPGEYLYNINWIEFSP